MKSFSIVVAIDTQNGIGIQNTLPWHLPQDMAYFKQLTSTTSDPDKKNAVIMGRNTWESIPEKFRPLKDRQNIVLTTQSHYSVPNTVWLASSLENALTKSDHATIETCFIIGGANLYAQAIQHPKCTSLFITHIDHTFDCDAFFPEFKSKFTCRNESATKLENDIAFRFCTYVKNR